MSTLSNKEKKKAAIAAKIAAALKKREEDAAAVGSATAKPAAQQIGKRKKPEGEDDEDSPALVVQRTTAPTNPEHEEDAAVSELDDNEEEEDDKSSPSGGPNRISSRFPNQALQAPMGRKPPVLKDLMERSIKEFFQELLLWKRHNPGQEDRLKRSDYYAKDIPPLLETIAGSMKWEERTLAEIEKCIPDVELEKRLYK